MGKIISFANQKGGVGKTTSAVNIAASLGVLGYKILLIDLDPQGNATSGVGILKKDLKTTVFDVLTSDTTADEATIKTRYDNLSIIPTHTTLARAEYDLGDVENGEYILKNKLGVLRNKYDYIIIDTPPVLLLSDALALATVTDGTVVVCRHQVSYISDIERALDTLSFAKANVLGVVVNDYKELKTSKGYGGYKKYYYYNSYSYGSTDPNEKDDDVQE